MRGIRAAPAGRGRDLALFRSADLEDDICPLDGSGSILRNGCTCLLIGGIQEAGSLAGIGLNCNQVAGGH